MYRLNLTVSYSCMAVLPNLSDNMKESSFNTFFIQYVLVNSRYFLGNVWMFDTFFCT